MIGEEPFTGRPRTGSAAGVRARSKSVFGNQDRLDVADAIAQDSAGLVNATQLAYELNLPANRVRAQLLALEQAGLVSSMPPDGRTRWYKREPSAFWQLCRDLLAEWTGDD